LVNFRKMTLLEHRMRLIAYLTGKFYLSSELQAFWMAFEGAMAVRNGLNRDKKLNWFHAFLLSVLTGYAGGTFGQIFFAKPSSMLSNDLNLGACILAFLLVNHTPGDVGRKLGNTFPGRVVTTLFAQLFRVSGLISYTDMAFHAFKQKPSAYYPTPVFGPVLHATLLGNMGGFFHKGFDGHLKNGVPWAFQNGMFCAAYYNFYVNDQEGFIGEWLRWVVGHLPIAELGLDDRTVAIVFVSSFMHIMGLLRLPYFFGPTFSPFTFLSDALTGRTAKRAALSKGAKVASSNGSSADKHTANSKGKNKKKNN